jgi:hypothetical protein
MSEKRKKNDLTIYEKMSILQRYNNLPKMGQREAAIKLQISEPLLCKLLKQRIEIENSATFNKNPNIKSIRSEKEEQAESALSLWFINVRKNYACINGSILIQKVVELAKE